MKWLNPRLSALILFLASAGGAQPQDPASLRPDDVVDVVVLGQPSLSANFVVGKDGAIAYPLIGRVEAAGLTPQDLAQRLQSLLGAGFLKRPEVSVRVKEYRSRPVLILGEVARPGIFSLKGDRSLLWRNFFGDNICLRSQENGDKMRYK